MTIRPPTFDECEALAIFTDALANRSRVYAESAADADVRRRFYREAEALNRITDILGFIGQRSTRLHLLLEPAPARERRIRA